jgi:hypothetical protein
MNSRMVKESVYARLLDVTVTAQQGEGPGVRRDELLRKAAQTEAAAEIKEWLISSGLRASTLIS